MAHVLFNFVKKWMKDYFLLNYYRLFNRFFKKILSDGYEKISKTYAEISNSVKKIISLVIFTKKLFNFIQSGIFRIIYVAFDSSTISPNFTSK